jgi:hypothetical protein
VTALADLLDERLQTRCLRLSTRALYADAANAASVAGPVSAALAAGVSAMKRALSLVRAPGRPAPVLAGALAMAAVLAVAITTTLVIEAVALREALPQLRARAARLADEPAPAPAAQPALPPDSELAALRRRVATVNALGGAGYPSLVTVLARLERLLPDDARLASLRYAREQGITTLVTEAHNTEVLTAFLQRLEQSGDYAEVLLLRQTQDARGRQGLRQIELRLTERP